MDYAHAAAKEIAYSEEIWKPVVGFEKHYSVSSLGRIRRDAYSPNTNVGKILKHKASRRLGYVCVSLSVDGRAYTKKPHKLVAEAFLGPCPPGHEVNHKDRDRTNAALSNLQYVTHQQNLLHARRLDPMAYRKIGENNGSCKLTDAQVSWARRIGRHKEILQRDLAEVFGVSLNYMSRLLRNELRTVFTPKARAALGAE